jgi:MFS family permease
MSASRVVLFSAVFVLCAADFLQSGMIAFAAGPIMGEIGAGPEDFSLVASLYACVAVMAIAKQQWLVENLGWRPYLAGTTAVYIIGALCCAHSTDLVSFAFGRIVMALGGGAFMTSARILVNFHPQGPGRFTGVRFFASGLAIGTTAAPYLASVAIIHDEWSLIFYGLLIFAIFGACLALVVVPKGKPAHERMANLAPARLLLLGTSCFFLLYLLQRSYYDFYNDTAVLVTFAVLAGIGLYAYLHLEHHHRAPMIRLREIVSGRFLSGMALFAFCYVVLGANNYLISVFLQRGLGYSWETTGMVESMGLVSTLATWLVMSWLLPRYPSLPKFLFAGIVCLAAFGWSMSRLPPDADAYGHVVPYLVLNGCFVMFGLATAATHSFKSIAGDDRLFAHGYQVKSILSQLSMALGTTLSTVVFQWRSTVQYERIGSALVKGNPTFEMSLRHASGAMALQGGGTGQAAATASVAQELSRQASMVACLEYFLALFGLAVCAFALVVATGCLRHITKSRTREKTT